MGDEKTLWVGSLPNDVSEKELREKFQKCGRVEDVYISRGHEEQFLWGFVEFSDSRSRDMALFLREDELFLRGQLLKVKKGHRNNPNNARASSQRSYGRWQGRDDWNRNRWEDRGHRQNGEKSSWQGRNGYWVDGGDSDYPMKNQVKAGHEGRRIHVGNLPTQVRRVDVERHFRDCGQIEFISLKHKDSESFCFMGFETSKAAEMAVQDLDQSRVYGNQIKVSLSRPPSAGSPKSHRSVEYADWSNEAYHSPQRAERTRPRDRDGREGSRSHSRRNGGVVPTHHRSEAPPTEERRDDVDSEESIESSDSDFQGSTKVKPTVTNVSSANLAEPQEDEEESSSSSSFCSEDDEKAIDRKEEPQASEVPEMLQASEPGDGEGGDDSRPKRRRRRKVDENGQPQRSTRKRRKRRRSHEAPEAPGHGGHEAATAPAGPGPAFGFRSPSRVRDRSGATRTLEVKPPLQRKRGLDPLGIRVRVENLPDDMNLDEFRNTGESFGEVLEVKLWKSSDGSKTGHITFTESTDVARVLSKLDNRRVEGWDRRLHCFVASQV